MKSIRLLNTGELTAEIGKMFERERELLIIASPFVDVRNNLIKMLSSSPAKIQFFIKTPKDDEIQKIEAVRKKLPNVEFIKIRNLHAKAYISGDCSIVASLNLQRNPEKNLEVGILFKNADHPEMHKKLVGEFENLPESSKSRFPSLKTGKTPSELIKDWSPPYSGMYNMKYLYREIMRVNGKDWIKDDPYDTIYRLVCEKIIEKYKKEFKPGDYYQGSTTMLKRQAFITKEMGLYAINNIKV